MIATTSSPSNVNYINNAQTSKRIRNFLQFTHLEYCNHQFENYEAFLNQDFNEDWVMNQKIGYSSAFREFWNEEWMLRNRLEFLPFAEDNTFDFQDLRREYFFIHCPQRLLNQPAFLSRYELILNSLTASKIA